MQGVNEYEKNCEQGKFEEILLLLTSQQGRIFVISSYNKNLF